MQRYIPYIKQYSFLTQIHIFQQNLWRIAGENVFEYGTPCTTCSVVYQAEEFTMQATVENFQCTRNATVNAAPMDDSGLVTVTAAASCNGNGNGNGKCQCSFCLCILFGIPLNTATAGDVDGTVLTTMQRCRRVLAKEGLSRCQFRNFILHIFTSFKSK